LPTFGDLFSKARKDAGMTQEDVAQRLGMSVRTVQHYEQDQRTPPLKKIPVICEILGVPPTYFSFIQTAVSEQHRTPDGDYVNVEPNVHRKIHIDEAEQEFLKWVKDNLEGSFFYDFEKSPEDAKKHMMETLRLVWERERGRKPGQKQGE